MLFNSYIFIFLFFPLTLIGYFGLSYARKYKAAHAFLVGMSLWFYGYNNIYYLAILIVSIILNYGIANRMKCLKAGRMRRFVMLAGVFLNIGILLYFNKQRYKYVCVRHSSLYCTNYCNAAFVYYF